MIITIIMIIKQNSVCSLKNKRTQSILFKNKKELLELLGNAHDTLVFLTFFLSPFGWKLSLIQAFPEEKISQNTQNFVNFKTLKLVLD